MNDSHDFLVGTVVGFHALAGEMKVRPSTNNPDLLLDFKTMRVEFAPGMAPDATAEKLFTVRSLRVEKRMLFVTFKGINDRNEAEYFDGAKLYAKQSELLPLEEEEFWVSDLVGMNVVTTGGASVGKVISIISAGSDILEVAGEAESNGKTILIPFVKDICPVVDMKARRIEVVDLPGLLEPQ